MPWRDWFIVAAIVFVAAMALIGRPTSNGRFTYFCPQTLQLEYQTEQTLLGQPIYRSQRQAYPNGILERLVSKGIVEPDLAATRHWWLISHTNEDWPLSDPTPLGKILLWRHKETFAWMDEHPECARLYWSEAFRLLRSENENDQRLAEELLFMCRGITNLDEMHSRIELSKR